MITQLTEMPSSEASYMYVWDFTTPHYYLATTKANWVQFFTGFLCCTYVEIHQVRWPLFDKYQRCPVSLICTLCFGIDVLTLAESFSKKEKDSVWVDMSGHLLFAGWEIIYNKCTKLYIVVLPTLQVHVILRKVNMYVRNSRSKLRFEALHGELSTYIWVVVTPL